MKKLQLIICALICFVQVKAQSKDKQIIEMLLHNTVKVYQMMRADNGLYYDYVGTKAQEPHGSTASIGMGLVSQCIGYEKGWTPNAEAEIVETLEAVLGHNDKGIKIARTPNNCFIHFYNIHTGEAIGQDWSPIDTDIMISGALFAKRYFYDNDKIAELADELYAMVDHSLFVGNVEKGQISLKMNADGSPFGAWTLPYNEYMMVAWLAKNQASSSEAPAERLWEKWYGNPANLPRVPFKSLSGDTYNVSTDLIGSKEFTSQFTFMFNYLFVNEFTTSESYLRDMRNAALADRAWWNDQKSLTEMGKQDYEWGTTAGFGLHYKEGNTREGYCVDKICALEDISTARDKNKGLNVAPSALAGFSPVLPDLVRADLLAMYRDERDVGKMRLPAKEGISDGNDYVLWKYSYRDLDWTPSRIEGVDYACMLLGLAALPEMLGTEFFKQYNDFFNPNRPNYRNSKKALIVVV